MTSDDRPLVHVPGWPWLAVGSGGWLMFRSTRRNAVSHVIFLTNSVHRFPPCSRVGMLTRSPLTPYCANRCPCWPLPRSAWPLSKVRRAAPVEIGRDTISRGWSRDRTGPPIGFFRMAGFGLFRLSTSSLFTMRTFAERIGFGSSSHASDGCRPMAKRSPREPLLDSAIPGFRARDRTVWNRRAGIGSIGRAAGSTQGCSGRTPHIHLRTRGCGAGRGERTRGGRCGGASHALRE